MHAAVFRFAFASLIGCAACAASAEASTHDIATLIQRQSQAFSDASAINDAAVLARLLDRDVTFMLENGQLVTKKEIVDGARAANTPHIHNHLEQRDFAVHVYGTTAVTSFTDVSSLDYFGKPATFRFRSTEVWRRAGGRWLMISSQTVNEPKDPPAIELPTSTLDEYVGRYELSADYVLTIARDGDRLTGTVLGNTSPLQVEVKDVLFVPGAPTLRRIVQRDPAGHVVGMISRREGTDFVMRKVS